MRSLWSFDAQSWDNAAVPLIDRVAAMVLLAGSVFIMPTVVNCFLGNRLDVPDVLIFSALPGVIAYRLIPASAIPLRRVTPADVKWCALVIIPLLLTVGIITLGWTSLLKLFQIPFMETQPWLAVIKEYHGVQLVQLFFGLCVLPPVVEELLFRRLIYGELLRFGAVTAFVVTAVLFSVCHFFVAGIPGLFVLGVAFQLMFLKQKNLAAAMVLHGLVNAVAFFNTVFS